jgi:hypothetical protein
VNDSLDRSLRPYVSLFDDLITSHQANGAAGDWHALRRKLDAVERRVDQDDGVDLDPPQLVSAYEQEVVLEVLVERLLPAVRQDLVQELRAGRGSEVDLGPWAGLDDRARAMDRKHAAAAEASIVAALGRYASNPVRSAILEALRALEDLERLQAYCRPSADAKVLREHGERLAKAAAEVLPRLARRILSELIEDRFRSWIEGKPIAELGPVESRWHNKLRGVGSWYPVWHQLRSGGDEPEPLGPWFVPAVQSVYELRCAQMDAERKHRLRNEEEERRREADLADQRRQEEGRRDLTDREARVLEEMEAGERERTRRAALEAELEARRQELEEQGRRRRAEQLERERIERAEMNARTRRLHEPTRSAPSWNYPPDEVRRFWAEGQLERWCKSKGLMPHEISAADRAKFLRYL